jgi:hypothetical protein
MKKLTSFIIPKLYLYFGLRISVQYLGIKRYFNFRKELKSFKQLAGDSLNVFPVKKLWPIYADKNDTAGTLSQYFYQDLFVATRIFKNNPETHADVGSRVDGFVAHVASFRKLVIYDVRPLNLPVPNVTFRQADFMKPDSIVPESVDSLSCLHALEHFGLGRYGDPICPEGHLIGFRNMCKMVKTGGTFYLSVPLGPQRIDFHAHRVFSLDYLVKMVSPDFEIIQFSYIDDQCRLFQDVEITQELTENNCNCFFGCAIFELKKR